MGQSKKCQLGNNQKEVIDEAQQEGKTVISQRTWIVATSKIQNWTNNFKSTKGAPYYVVTQWRMIQDPMRCSLNKVPLHRTCPAAKVLGVFSRLQRMRRGSQRRCVSVHSEKNARCSQIVEITWSCVPSNLGTPTRFWKTKMMDNIPDLVVPLERNLYGHPSAGFLCEPKLAEVLSEERWERVPGWECLYMHRPRGLFTTVYVLETSSGKTACWNPMLMGKGRLGRTNPDYWPSTRGTCAARKYVLSAFMHCALARIPVSSPHLRCTLSSSQFSFISKISDRKVIGHCPSEPLKSPWCAFHIVCNCTNTQIRTKDITHFSSGEQIYNSRCATNCTSCWTSRCNCSSASARTWVVSLALLPEQHLPQVTSPNPFKMKVEHMLCLSRTAMMRI